MKRIKLSTLMISLTVLAMALALFLQARKIEHLEAALSSARLPVIPSGGPNPFVKTPRAFPPTAQAEDPAKEQPMEPIDDSALPDLPAVPTRTLPLPSSLESVPLDVRIQGLEAEIKALIKEKDRLERQAQEAGKAAASEPR